MRRVRCIEKGRAAMKHMFLLALGVVGCAADGTDARYVADFHPPEVAAGYTRFLTPPTKGIAPGDL